MDLLKAIAGAAYTNTGLEKASQISVVGARERLALNWFTKKNRGTWVSKSFSI